jgi:hypothetical protein
MQPYYLENIDLDDGLSVVISDLKELVSWNSFAASLVEQYDRKGSLSEKQISSAKSMISKVKEKKTFASIDLSGVKSIFDKAHKAIKTPKFRYDDIVISRAPDHGANKGALYVKINGDYVGKVADGCFKPRNAPEGTLSKLKAIAKDPLSSAIAYGRKTGQCACCGRELTNHGSIDRGIGPICVEKWGLDIGE